MNAMGEAARQADLQAVRQAVADLADPEIPVISLGEMARSAMNRIKLIHRSVIDIQNQS